MPYYQMEEPHNLARMPSITFTVACLPVKIERGSAGWVGAAALVKR
jgi:kynurenine formamidase